MARKLRYNDEEGGMIKAQLMKIENYAAKLNEMIHPDDEIEGWVQAKLAVVAAYMGDVKHYLDYELKQAFGDGGGVGGFKPRYWEVEFTWNGEPDGDGRKVNVMADSVADAEQKVKNKFGAYYKGLKVVEVEEDKEMTWDEYAATKGVKKMEDGGDVEFGDDGEEYQAPDEEADRKYRKYEEMKEEEAIRSLERDKVNLSDLEIQDGLYYIGNIYDTDTDGWVEEKDAREILSIVNKERSMMADGGMMAKGYAKGGVVNMDRHVWEGWTVGDFIRELEIPFRYHSKFNSKEEVKKWAMSEQPYYKKYIPEVVTYFWQKNEEKYAKGGKTEPDEIVYIEYFNKDKKFAKDKKEFIGQNAYNEAVSWGRKNIGNFNLDMVKFKMAEGGNVPSKYVITYDDGDDISRIWVYANNEEDAQEQAFEEYWDIKEIISVQKMKADGGMMAKGGETKSAKELWDSGKPIKKVKWVTYASFKDKLGYNPDETVQLSYKKWDELNKDVQKALAAAMPEKMADGGETKEPVYVEITKPTDLKLNRIRRKVEELSDMGYKSGDILLKMLFVTDEPKILANQFRVLKNQVFFDKADKSYYKGGKLDDLYIKYEGSTFAEDMLEAREWLGEDRWKQMTRDERIEATKYLKATGKVGYIGEYEDLETVAAMQYAKGGTVSGYDKKQLEEKFKEREKYKTNYSTPKEWKTYYDVWEELTPKGRESFLKFISDGEGYLDTISDKEKEQIIKTDYRNADVSKLTKPQVVAWLKFTRYAYQKGDTKRWNKE